MSSSLGNVAQRSQGAAAAASDPLRDSFLRYTAFTSDLGEAFKLYISRRVYFGSYAVVGLYGLVDTADKGRRTYQRVAARSSHQGQHAQHPPAPAQACAPLQGLPLPLPLAAAAAACLPAPHAVYAAANSISEPPRYPAAVPVAAAVLDTALWHSAASLVIPGVAINRTVWATRALLSLPAAAARLHPRLAAALPPAAGLALIPLAVHSIDEGVTRWMEAHVRPHLPRDAQPQPNAHSAH